ncbi:hypothetical protein LTR29_006478 [Friedmanniomyces endolithicus]|nr:hypothetical protein LTR29_006478 [Friedmanniomyces endolithicus]KAK1813033.1 hypothetical protein LTR12_012555 [Friedmanniomyces endolithicus]
MLRPLLRLASARPTLIPFPLVNPTLTPALSLSRRPFTALPRLLLKEDSTRTPEELDAKKHEQLDKQKKGENTWDEGLASSSESQIAADKEEVQDHGKHMEELQKQTAGESEKEHPEGKA